jgi:hypothetical protein
MRDDLEIKYRTHPCQHQTGSRQETQRHEDRFSTHAAKADTKRKQLISREGTIGAAFPSLMGSTRTMKPKEGTHETIV